MSRGLYDKYTVIKNDRSEIDQDADYFVIRIDSDKHARVAALAYADSIKEENPHLSFDIKQRVAKYEGGMFNG